MGNLNLPQMTAGQSNKHVTSNDGDEAIDKAITESEILDFTAGNITLTDAQLRENFLFECNNVAAARDLTLPATVIKRFFSVTNQADETFNVTVKKGSASVVVTPGDTTIMYTDGSTNDLREIVAGGGTPFGGAFLDLSDVDPTSYSGQAGKVVTVNATPDGLEFKTPGAVGGGGVPGTFFGLIGGMRNRQADPDSNDDIYLDSILGGVFEEDVVFSGVPANLKLDTATTGAGGLDTGVKVTDEWYDWWLIQRSDTEAFALLGSLAADWRTDQAGVTNNANARLNGATTNTDRIAQSFQPSVTEDLMFVNIVMNKLGAPIGSVWVTIEGDSAGDPDDTPIATSHKIAVPDFPTTDLEVCFVFPEPPALTASTTYWIVLRVDYTASDTVALRVRGNTTSNYSGGLAKAFDGATWSTTVDGSIVDVVFNTHMNDGGNNPSMPTNYDRRVKIGYFKVKSGATTLENFRQIDKTVFWYDDQLVTGATAAAVIYESLQNLIPPTPVMAEIAVSNSFGTTSMDIGMPPFGHGAGLVATATPKDLTKTVQESGSVVNKLVDTGLHYVAHQGFYIKQSLATGNMSYRVLNYTFQK